MDYSILVHPEYLTQHEKSLDRDLLKTVRKRGYPSDVKLALFRQKNFRRRLLKDKGQEITVKSKKPPPQLPAEPPAQPPIDPIVTNLPISLQSKGEQFLQYLKNIPDFGVNEKGEITYRGHTVPGSRIFDLVHDFVRYRPSKSPAKGWQVLAIALKNSNIPREFIGNPSRWQYMQSLDSEETPARPLGARKRIRAKRRIYQSGTGLALKKLKWKTC